MMKSEVNPVPRKRGRELPIHTTSIKTKHRNDERHTEGKSEVERTARIRASWTKASDGASHWRTGSTRARTLAGDAWYEQAWGPKIYSWKMNWLCKGGCTVPGGSMRKVSGLSNKRVGNGFVQGKDADYNFLFLGGSIRTSRGTLGMPEFPFPRTMKCRVEVTQACFFEE
jgi:hypothetical protein